MCSTSLCASSPYVNRSHVFAGSSVSDYPTNQAQTCRFGLCDWCLIKWGCTLNPRRPRILGVVTGCFLALWLWQPLMLGNSQTQDTENKQIEIKLIPLKKSIKAGESLEVRVEIWNRGPTPLFIRQATHSLCASGPLTLRLELGPPVKPKQGVSCAEDCIYGSDDSFAAKLASEWTILSRGAFYGAVDEMYPDAFPQLNTPCKWRLVGTYESRGDLSLSLCWNPKPAPDEQEQLKKLRYQAWQGTIETNKVWIEITQGKSSTNAKKSR